MAKHRIRQLVLKAGINPIKLVDEKGKELGRIEANYNPKDKVIITPKTTKLNPKVGSGLEVG